MCVWRVAGAEMGWGEDSACGAGLYGSEEGEPAIDDSEDFGSSGYGPTFQCLGRDR
jgi:hypothetical protein